MEKRPLLQYLCDRQACFSHQRLNAHSKRRIVFIARSLEPGNRKRELSFP
jgi:hypothetical protein